MLTFVTSWIKWEDDQSQLVYLLITGTLPLRPYKGRDRHDPSLFPTPIIHSAAPDSFHLFWVKLTHFILTCLNFIYSNTIICEKRSFILYMRHYCEIAPILQKEEIFFVMEKHFALNSCTIDTQTLSILRFEKIWRHMLLINVYSYKYKYKYKCFLIYSRLGMWIKRTRAQ